MKIKHKTDEQINPVNGLEPWDQSYNAKIVPEVLTGNRESLLLPNMIWNSRFNELTSPSTRRRMVSEIPLSSWQDDTRIKTQKLQLTYRNTTRYSAGSFVDSSVPVCIALWRWLRQTSTTTVILRHCNGLARIHVRLWEIPSELRSKRLKAPQRRRGGGSDASRSGKGGLAVSPPIAPPLVPPSGALSWHAPRLV